MTQDIILLAKFYLQNAEGGEIETFFENLSASVNDGTEVSVDEAILAGFGVAAGIAEATENPKDEQFIEDLKELYVNLKDPETGIIADLRSFFAARREAKK